MSLVHVTTNVLTMPIEQNDFFNEQQLNALVQSGIPCNIKLAFQLAKGLNIAIKTKDYWNLHAWISPNILNTNPVDDLSMVLDLYSINTLSMIFEQKKRIPSKIGRLKNIQKAFFSCNKFSALPLSIYMLHQLKVLYLDFNKIKIISSKINKLHELEILKLDHNQICAVPKNLFRLPKLNILNLAHNFLTQLPRLTAPNQIQNLDLSNNKIQNIPESIAFCVQLVQLNLAGNPITKLPPNLSSLKHLEVLILPKHFSHCPAFAKQQQQLPNCSIQFVP